MNLFTIPDRIFVSLRSEDMRAIIQRLVEVAAVEFERGSMDGALYVFVSRDCELYPASCCLQHRCPTVVSCRLLTLERLRGWR